MKDYVKVKVGSGGPSKNASSAAFGLVTNPSARYRALAGLTQEKPKLNFY